uniref:Silicon transporter n=1 Tax=Panagrolaimus sp. ES5 TaxID=591445 RepID=A0AC34FRB5_9BILA
MSNISGNSNIVNDNNDDDAQMLHPLEEEQHEERQNGNNQNIPEGEENEGAPEDPKIPTSTEENDQNKDDEVEEEILPETFKDYTREFKPQSNVTDDVYIQMKKRFRRLLKSQIQGSKTESDENDPEVSTLLRQYFGSVMSAVIIQMLLHNVTLVLQGLLAGLACGHCVFAFVFAEPDVLIRGYQWMAVPVQAAFYFCFAISTVNAFDRFEAGASFIETIKKFLSLQRGGFNVIIWTAGTIGSVLMATYDEYMAKPDIVIIEKSETLIIWRYLSLWRATCALLGWLFVALQPNTNYTRDRLLRLAGVS